MLWLAAGIIVTGLFLALALAAFLRHPKFGAYPGAGRIERHRRSPHFRDDGFAYPLPTPLLVEDVSLASLVRERLFGDTSGRRPSEPVETLRTDLAALDPQRDTLIWLGHSSYFLQLAGRRILIDPVFSSDAAPVPFAVRSFPGTDLYDAADMPEIDLLLITHDHWDHLDHRTLVALRSRVRRVVAPLGVGEHLDRWGCGAVEVTEVDWFDRTNVGAGLAVHLVPSRHFSGRLFTRSKSLWGGYVLETGSRRLFFSGDSGYGPHFREIGERFGGFDLAALDMGQYDSRWPHVHMTPEQAAVAARDLGTRVLIPAHVGRFSLARHHWRDPFTRIRAAALTESACRLVVPKIGAALLLDDLDAGGSLAPELIWRIGEP